MAGAKVQPGGTQPQPGSMSRNNTVGTKLQGFTVWLGSTMCPGALNPHCVEVGAATVLLSQAEDGSSTGHHLPTLAFAHCPGLHDQ